MKKHSYYLLGMLSIVFIFSLILPLYGQTPTPPSKVKQTVQKASPSNQNAHQDPYGTEPKPFIVKVLPTVKSKAETDQETDERNRKMENETWIRWATVSLALVTTGLAIFTAFLWKSTSKLVSASKETSIQQLRAYVHAGLPEIGRAFSDENGHLSVELIIKNYGQTPAYQLKSSAFIGFYKLPLSKILDSANYGNGSLGCIAPNQFFRVYPVLGRKLDQSEINDIKVQKAGIYVWGYLEYIDIFKAKRTTEFKMLSTGNDFRDGVFAYCTDGNEAT